MNRVTVSSGLLRELAIDEALVRFAEGGIGGIELGVDHDKLIVAAGGDVLERAARVGARAAQLGVPIVQMHAPMVNVCSPDEPGAVEALFHSIARAKALGAHWLVVHPGYDPAAGSSRRIDQAVHDANLRAFERLLGEAERLGVGLAIENMTTYSARPAYPKMDIRFGQSAADLLWLSEQLSSPHLAICWDTGHAHTQGIDQPAALREIGTLLKAVHLHDNDGTADSHWMPLRGTIKWTDLFSALGEIGFAGPLNFEISGERRFPVPLRSHSLPLARAVAEHLQARVRNGE